jgi:ribosomal protein L12E/L44/L45/RPP1/RPP2
MLTNRVFHAFGIKAPPHVAALRHKAAEDKKKDELLSKTSKDNECAVGGSATARSETKKRKRVAKSRGAPKRSWLIDAVLSIP